MSSPPHREGTISPELTTMVFERPEHITAGEYYDEKAVKISNLIDEELRKESARRKDASRKEVKVMLLGQAESGKHREPEDSLSDVITTISGKSTLQKQFQLYYASQTLDHERPSWRPVVYFNVLKAVRMTLDELDYEFNSKVKATDPNAITEIPVASSSSRMLLPQPVSNTDIANEFTQQEIGELRAKLLPLVAIEDTLASELSGGVSVSGGRTGAYVRAGWQGLVTSAWPLGDSRPAPLNSHSSESVQLAAKTLGATKDAIKALWSHRAVKRLLEAKKLRLEESAPLYVQIFVLYEAYVPDRTPHDSFLDNIDHIAQPDFLPSNADILNVRLQTLGVMEHTFPINMGGVTYDWKLYDVGGARGQVHRRKDIAKRSLYVHFTSMLDIKATQSIIANGESELSHLKTRNMTKNAVCSQLEK
ncbi:hypothetical protein DXG01_016092 [Tephrocybe rancida]|nr:hypothetical protein DXG01_016092 [Tephrocybe rancida]